MATPLNQSYLLKSTGREYGPDIALKVIIPAADKMRLTALRVDKYPIKDDSSITEVLNVIAFLCNENRGAVNADSIEKTMSIADDGKYGLHDVATGLYDDTGLNGTIVPSPQALIDTAASLYGNIATPFNLATLVAGTNFAGQNFPQGLMKRSGDPNAATNLYPPQVPHILAAGTNASLMSNAILQAIHILERTREILGPKGWTDLFKKIKGGGGSKKTQHRRHRRRYSSKQY